MSQETDKSILGIEQIINNVTQNIDNSNTSISTCIEKIKDIENVAKESNDVVEEIQEIIKGITNSINYREFQLILLKPSVLANNTIIAVLYRNILLNKLCCMSKFEKKCLNILVFLVYLIYKNKIIALI